MSLACGNGADHLLLCVAISFKATMWKEPWLHLVAWHSKGKKIAVFTRKSSRFLTLGYFHFSRVPNLNYLSKTVPTRRNNKKKHVFFQQNGRTLANGICRITFVSTSICQLITGKKIWIAIQSLTSHGPSVWHITWARSSSWKTCQLCLSFGRAYLCARRECWVDPGRHEEMNTCFEFSPK